MVLSPAGGSDSIGSIEGGEDLHFPPPEQSPTVYCNQTHCEPVSSGSAEAGVKGVQAVVESGRTGCGGYSNRVLGGVTDRGRGGYRRDGY